MVQDGFGIEKAKPSQRRLDVAQLDVIGPPVRFGERQRRRENWPRHCHGLERVEIDGSEIAEREQRRVAIRAGRRRTLPCDECIRAGRGDAIEVPHADRNRAHGRQRNA